MKKLFSIKQFFFMGIILCNINGIFGQDTTRYFISAIVDFDQWCNCSNSEPTFDSAPKLSESGFTKLKNEQN